MNQRSWDGVITLAHGSGGRIMQQLLETLFLPLFDNPILNEREDQARLPLNIFQQQGDRLAFSTDSYVIDPIFFPGGDIGKLAVCGTANDLAVSGALPQYLSCGFILEEGFPLQDLATLVHSMAKTAQAANLQIVTGDTKVVPHGAADKIFINTSGIGTLPASINWGATQIQPGDKLIVSGTLGDHGATILNLRENLGLATELKSDCAVLTSLIISLHPIPGIRALRDATRGGVTAILHEFAQSSHCGMVVREDQLPLKSAVRGICELLGLDALNFANEGKVVIVVAPESEQKVLDTLHHHPLGRDATTIGHVADHKQVYLIGPFGASRLLDLPHSEPLPRIC